MLLLAKVAFDDAIDLAAPKLDGVRKQSLVGGEAYALRPGSIAIAKRVE